MKTYEKFNEPKIKINYWDNGQKGYEQWSLNGKFAQQGWYENGQKSYEYWSLNGKLHREDRPAQQGWFENGQKEYEFWYLNSKSHREDGPAEHGWYENGQKGYEFWVLNDIRYSREEWVEKLGKIGSPHYEEQRMLLDMEKYNL